MSMKKKRLRESFPLLKILCGMKAADRTVVLKFLNAQGCESIYECIVNGIRNKSLSTKKQKLLKKGLLKDKDIYRSLTKGKKSSKKKQKNLVQVGGSIGLILSTVLPILANFLFGKK